MVRALCCAIPLVQLAALTVLAEAPDSDAGIPPVIIDYFYEAGCPDCLRVRRSVMPELREGYEGFYVLNRYDIGIKTNVTRLLAYQEHLGIVENEPVAMVVDYKHVLNGYAAIRRGLLARLDQCVTERLDPEWHPPPPIAVQADPDAAGELAESRLRSFTLPLVMTGGLLDGINPCAFSAMVFFVSLLAVAKVGRRKLLLVGISFCAASFLTYTAIGFGLLRAFHLMRGVEPLRTTITFVLAIALLVLAIVSFRDAYRYRASGNPRDVALRLLQPLQNRIHALMRRGVGSSRIVGAAFAVGIAVTAIESICTGQVYVPTLVTLINSGIRVSKAWAYLLVYNLMFILPLLAVFILAYVGLGTFSLVEWSRKNVVLSKTLLGFFFLTLAAATVIASPPAEWLKVLR